jgi:hypothetical protein
MTVLPLTTQPTALHSSRGHSRTAKEMYRKDDGRSRAQYDRASERGRSGEHREVEQGREAKKD